MRSSFEHASSRVSSDRPRRPRSACDDGAGGDAEQPREVGLAEVALRAHGAQRGAQARRRRGGFEHRPAVLALVRNTLPSTPGPRASALAIRRRPSLSVNTHWVTSGSRGAAARARRRGRPTSTRSRRPRAGAGSSARRTRARCRCPSAPPSRRAGRRAAGCARRGRSARRSPAGAARDGRAARRARVDDLEARIGGADLLGRAVQRDVRREVVRGALAGDRRVEGLDRRLLSVSHTTLSPQYSPSRAVSSSGDAGAGGAVVGHVRGAVRKRCFIFVAILCALLHRTRVTMVEPMLEMARPLAARETEGPHGPPASHVLVAVDETPGRPRRTLVSGLAHAAAQGADVTVLHVVPPRRWRIGRLGPTRAVPMHSATRSRVRSCVTRSASRSTAVPAPRLELVAADDVDAVILGVARAHRRGHDRGRRQPPRRPGFAARRLPGRAAPRARAGLRRPRVGPLAALSPAPAIAGGARGPRRRPTPPLPAAA